MNISVAQIYCMDVNHVIIADANGVKDFGTSSRDMKLNSYRNTQLSFYEGLNKTKQTNNPTLIYEYLSSSDTLYGCQSRDRC